MLNKILSIFAIASFIFVSALALPALAADAGQAAASQSNCQPPNYCLLAPIPLNGPGAGASNVANLNTYIPALYRLAIEIAGGLAVVMLIYAGIRYMSTDAFGGKEEAKGVIENALWGLLLAMSAWLIVNTINPDLVKFNLGITPITTTTSGTGATNVTPSPSGSSYNEVLNALSPGVAPYAGPCQNGATTGCVDLAGLQQSTIDGLKQLALSCSHCGTILITGGTEGGHTTNSAHNNGSAVDLRATTPLNQTIAGSASLVACQTYTNPAFTGRFLWEPKGETCKGEVPSSNDHWHVTY